MPGKSSEISQLPKWTIVTFRFISAGRKIKIRPEEVGAIRSHRHPSADSGRRYPA
jgi:hypothetical protein